jgi:hypothetical protein
LWRTSSTLAITCEQRRRDIILCKSVEILDLKMFAFAKARKMPKLRKGNKEPILILA